jgi:alpha-tubulin suppressor-like RCC1 family protein
MTPTITGRKFTVITKLMNRWSVVRAAVGLIAAGLVFACTDSQAPSVSDTGPSPFLVSSPVPDPSPSSSGAGTGRLSATVVYISLPPGAIPNGVNATIRDLRTGSAVTTNLVEGGFDPVAVSAIAGDTLTMAVHTTGGTAPTSYQSVVAGAKPPIVLRTDPPAHKRDVPLDVRIGIVFTEPIDPSSLTSGSIQLWRGTTPVPGQLASADPAHLMATFSPDAPLAALTDYELRVTQAVLGFDGVPLKAPVSVPFTTQAEGAGPLFTVGGTVSGLTGSGLVLLDNGGDPLTVASDGAFAFATPLASGATYSVSVFTQPTFPAQSCSIINAGGTVVVANVANVAIACTTGSPAGLVFTSVSAGFDHSCGLTTTGAAYCWGYNGLGELGDGTTANSSTPVAVVGGLSFAAVSAGYQYTCGITTGGLLYCWGRNTYGQLGGDTPGQSSVPVKFTDVGGLTWVGVSAGPSHACGITTAGAAYCWGSNWSGEGGWGGGLTFASVSAGGRSTCGVTTTGAAYCWGDNGAGELGTGSATGPEQCFANNVGTGLPPGGYYYPCSRSPVAVAGGLTFVQVEVQDVSACGLTPSGTVYCWGSNRSGQLGNGTTTGADICFDGPSVACTASPVAVAVAGGLSFTTLYSGGSEYACGLTSGGAAYCWGDNTNGVFGDGGGLTFAMVSAGDSPHCGVTTRGVAYCWGANSYGDLGDGTTTNSTVPVKVAGQP